MKINEKGQATVDRVIKMSKENFESDKQTVIYWLGNAGYMVHSHNTNIMVDPLLEGFDMPVLFNSPIDVNEVPSLDAICITHIDNDHFSIMTCNDLKPVTKEFHSTNYVASEMVQIGLNGIGHDIYDTFTVGDVDIRLTKAKHNWQKDSSKYAYREWLEEDYCGFYMETKDGSIWTIGDSKLLPEQLEEKEPDVIMFDFSDNPWHITFDGALEVGKVYPNAKLICIHWGTVDAPDFSPFNANPEHLKQHIVNPERVIVLNPGEGYVLKHD